MTAALADRYVIERKVARGHEVAEVGHRVDRVIPVFDRGISLFGRANQSLNRAISSF